MREAGILERLLRDSRESVRDPLWGSIFLTPGLSAVMAAPAFVKLSGIRQLGPAVLVYPGATHTRYGHSLGVYHGARRLVKALAARGRLDFVSEEGILSFLAAALCHDLGHFPYAHSLKDLVPEDHEGLGARLMKEEPLRSLLGAAGADPDLAAAIIDPDLPDGGRREVALFRSMLSGVLDPDKLDYLNRDAYFCGVPYGLQDVDYVLQRVDLGPGDRIGVDEKGLMSVESILFAKYLMYRSVYWHEGVRSATSMVKKSVYVAISEGAMAPEELYGLDDAGFVALMRGLSFSARGLAEAVFGRQPFPCVLDLPYDAADPRHDGLLDLARRADFERELAAMVGLSAFDLVVDIPESVSFDTDLAVIDAASASARPFSESSTVFSPAVVEGFARSLRRLRVFASRPSPALVAAARAALG